MENISIQELHLSCNLWDLDRILGSALVCMVRRMLYHYLINEELHG